MYVYVLSVIYWVNIHEFNRANERLAGHCAGREVKKFENHSFEYKDLHSLVNPLLLLLLHYFFN